MNLPGYPIAVNDPMGLNKINENFYYLEEKTNAMQAPPLVANSEEEMLALEAIPGNTCIRTDITDESNQFMLTAIPASDINNWLQMPMAVSAVSSVNGQTRNIELTALDIINPSTGQSVAADLSSLSLPIGTILTFPVASIPSNYLKCNGAAVGRDTYPELFALIGTTYGVGDGSTTFNLPDLRGIFIRGLSEGRVINGETVDDGRTLGSYQGDAIRNITGNIASYPYQVTGVGTGCFARATTTAQDSSTAFTGSQPSGFTFDASRVVPTAAENRPRNNAMIYIIKY